MRGNKQVARALYRKYRSKSLDEVVGQKHITDVLARALQQGRVAHAYLLTGPRGVGKTSIARILAHEINGLPYAEESTHLDIIEIDAASNNGVEDIRDLREKVQIAPVSADKKVYIIDEVHMLSKPAFNALLKTLEEPPAHVVFILATTDADKLPATIISRTQRFGFRAIPRADAVKHLRTIADKEKLMIDDESLELIAEHGDGSFRDSISLLDQLASLANTEKGITRELVEELLGLAPHAIIDKLLSAIHKHNPGDVIAILDECEANGLQSTVLATQLMRAVRNQLAEKPGLSSLLDQLLDVNVSRQPALKLLTVLVGAAEGGRSKTVALSAPTLEVSAPIKELEQQATKVHPHVSPVTPVDKPATKPHNRAAKIDKPTPQTHKDSDQKTTQPPKQHKADQTFDIDTFEWEKFINYAKEHHVAVYSVLSKCKYELDGSTLQLYTGNAFYKKKLDDSKYLPYLHEGLENIGAYGLSIETIPTPPPPKDSQAAAVAAIMGGGEEVSLDDA